MFSQWDFCKQKEGAIVLLFGLHVSETPLSRFPQLSQALLFFPSLTQSKNNKLCFEKALFTSALDHGAICLPPAHGPPTLSLSLLQGCKTKVEKWFQDNCGVILGICAGVAVIEVQSSPRLILFSHPRLITFSIILTTDVVQMCPSDYSVNHYKCEWFVDIARLHLLVLRC